MMNLSPDVIALMATWTVSVAAFAWWLSAQFRNIEQLIHRLVDQHKEEQRQHVTDLKERIMVLELKAFGYTPVNPRDGVHPPLPYRPD